MVLEAAVGVWFEKTEFGSTYFLRGFVPFFLPAFALLGGCMCCLTCKMQRRNGTLEDHEYVSTACKGIFAAERRSQIIASAGM